MDTLTNILGDGDGVKATATVKGTTYTVIQCLHTDDLGPYRSWIFSDSSDDIRFLETSFKTIEFYNPEGPVWVAQQSSEQEIIEAMREIA